MFLVCAVLLDAHGFCVSFLDPLKGKAYASHISSVRKQNGRRFISPKAPANEMFTKALIHYLKLWEALGLSRKHRIV